VSGTAVEFPARDGFRLAGTMFRPSTPNRRAVLIQAAAGVRQEFYGKFAAYLALRGMSVLTFDYRGIGRSRPPSLRGFRARMLDWADKDIPGALDYLARATQGARMVGVGHSFGGQVFGLVPGNERYVAAMTFGAQSGYWRHWPGWGKAGMWLLTHAVLPAVSRLNGYFPARMLGQGEDLPAGVATEWARWCRDPDYAVGALGVRDAYARFAAPMRMYAATDDAYAPQAAIDALAALYPNAPKKLERLDVSALAGGPIGHFGYFRDRLADSLWRGAADWLAAR
jgi:predicted alpha/beta hydrolase